MDGIVNEVSFDDILNYYGHNFYCLNCQYKNSRYIRKGVKIKDVSTVCEKCGCSISERR